MTEPIMVKPNSSRVAGRLSSQGRSTGVVGSLYLVPPLYGQQTITTPLGSVPPNWPIATWLTWYEGLNGWSPPGVTDLNGFTYSGGRLTAMARGTYRYHFQLGFNSAGASNTFRFGLSINSANPLGVTLAREQVSATTYRTDNVDSAAHVQLEPGDTVAVCYMNTWTGIQAAVWDATLRIESVNL